MNDSGLLKNRDIEYDELEFDRNDMLTGEPRYVEDEIRNSKVAMILGGIAGVLCLVAMILTWILYFRERTRTFLWHAIWLIFAFLFGFGLAAWGATSEPSVRVGKQPSANFTLAIFLGCLIFFVYLVAEALWLVFYKPIHYGYLVGLRGDNDLWNKRMISGSTFEEGWTADRRMMWWVTAFTLISGICFAFGAYATRSVVWNRFQLTRIGLFASIIGTAVAGFLIVYWAEECFEYENASFYSFDKDVTRVLKVLAIIAIVFAFLNGIVNFLKSKLGYFVMGLISVILIICLIASTGILWRNIRANQTAARTGDCTANLSAIHEDSLKDICINGGKYLPTGSKCTKELYVNRWENGSTAELRVLNPSCCQVGVSFFYLPYMQLAFWSVVLILCLGISILFNFYLSDTSDYLSNAARPLNIIDFLGIGLLVAVLLGWILYFIFRKANKLTAPPRGFAASYNDPDKNQSEGFTVVPRSVLRNAVTPEVAQATGTSTPYTLKGVLYFVKDGAQSGVVPGNLQIATSINGAAVGGAKNLMLGDSNQAIFTVADIPVYDNSNAILKISIVDPNNVFLSKDVEVFIPAKNGGSDELSAGKIRLLTADGKVCAVGDNACLTAQKRATGSIKFEAVDATNDAQRTALAGVLINVIRGHVTKGDSASSAISDISGIGAANNLQYDAYTAIATKTGYLPVSTRLDLQDANVNAPVFFLRPTSDDLDYRVFANMDDPTVDLDLKLNMRNPQGVTCQLSPSNKYCPYSAYLNDVAFGTGQEAIGIKRLAVAEYLSFVAPASAYDKSCPASEAYKSAAAHYVGLEGWNWETVKLTKPLESLGITSGTTSGSFGAKVVALISQLIPGLDSIAPKAPIETEAQSLVAKTLLGINGKALSPAQQVKVATNVKGNAKNHPQPADYVEKSKTTATADGIETTTIEFTDKHADNSVAGKKTIRKGTSVSNKTVVEGVDVASKITNVKGEEIGQNKENKNEFQFSNGSTQTVAKKFATIKTEKGSIETTSSDYKFKGSKTAPDAVEQSSKQVKESIAFPPTTKTTTNEQNTEVKGTVTTKKTVSSENSNTAGQVSESSKVKTEKTDSATGDSEEETVSTVSTANKKSTRKNTKKTVKGVTTSTITRSETTTIDKVSSKIESTKVVETLANKQTTIKETTTESQTTADGKTTETKTTTTVLTQPDGTSTTETTITSSAKNVDGSRSEETSTFKKVEKADKTSDSDHTTTTKNFDKDNKQTTQVVKTVTTNKGAKGTTKSTVETKTEYGASGPVSKVETQTLTSPLNDKEENSVVTTIVFKYDDKGVATVVSSDTKKTVTPIVVEPPQQKPTRADEKPHVRTLAVKYAHLATSSGASVLLLNCFNGFGPASTVTLNSYLPSEPSFDQCVPKIAATKPNFTIGKLEEAVKAAA